MKMRARRVTIELCLQGDGCTVHLTMSTQPAMQREDIDPRNDVLVKAAYAIYKFMEDEYPDNFAHLNLLEDDIKEEEEESL